MLGVSSRPIRTVLLWQTLITSVAAVLGGAFSGVHGAVSALLGGSIGLIGGATFAWMAGRNRAASADAVVFAALKAEGIKIVVFIALLAAVLATYKGCVVPVLIGTFIASTMVFSFAFFVRDA